MLNYSGSAVAAAADADMLLVLTDWQEFRDTDPALLGKAVAQWNVVDGRNALDENLWRIAGWSYYAPGRPAKRANSPGGVESDGAGS